MVIQRHLDERQQNVHQEALAYFYCDRNEPVRQDPEVILSALVKQLSFLQLDDPLQPLVVDEYEKREKSAPPAHALENDASRDLLIKLADIYPQTTIIIDALDEVDSKKRDGFIQSLQGLIQKSTGLVKLFISSRNEDDIKLQFEHVNNHYISADDNVQDIERFIDIEIENRVQRRTLLRGNVSDNLKLRISSSLKEKAQGM